MEEVREKRKFDHSMAEFPPAEKRQTTDEARAISIVNKTNEEILESVQSTTISLPCAPDKVANIIGRKGVVVQEIMKKSSCRIYVDQNFPEGHPRQVQITGHPKELGIAIALVCLVIEHGPSIVSPPAGQGAASTDGQETTDGDFLCPHPKVGALIGTRGSNVQEIFNRTGCKVHVLQDGVPDGVDRRVLFTGTPAQIQSAKQMVVQLIESGSMEASGILSAPDLSSSNPSQRTIELDIVPDKVRLVIGSKGVTISEIMKRSGCKVFINQNFPEGQMHKVVFTGTLPQIDIARYLVDTVCNQGITALYSVLNGSEAVVAHELYLQEAQAQRLRVGESLSEVQARCAVRVNVDSNPDPMHGNSFRVSIVGKVDSIHMATKLIDAVLNNFPLDSRTVSEALQTPQPTGPVLALGKDGTNGHLESAVPLPDGSYQQVAEIKNEFMGRIMGSRSATLQLIKSKSGANLQVLKPDATKNTTRIVITGPNQVVSLASQMVQEVLVNGTGKILKMPDATAMPLRSQFPMTTAPDLDSYYQAGRVGHMAPPAHLSGMNPPMHGYGAPGAGRRY